MQIVAKNAALNLLLFQGVTTGTAYDFSDLEPGHEYGFAVKAANAVGESDPLPTAKLILAKDQFFLSNFQSIVEEKHKILPLFPLNAEYGKKSYCD